MPVMDLSCPFYLVVADAVAPPPTPERGNKYNLEFAKFFTRWVEAITVKSLDTITFVEVMVGGVISRHGVQEGLLSDRGPNFTSGLTRSLTSKTSRIKKLFSTAYHPQTQGLVERFNVTLLNMLRMYVHKSQKDWDVYL
ncbi:hypothetical protein PC128_g25037 [Phytophthora cactorum]|nr:hypothetical protein PC128_g25037 [Phytophthora cactorum]